MFLDLPNGLTKRPGLLRQVQLSHGRCFAPSHGPLGDGRLRSSKRSAILVQENARY